MVGAFYFGGIKMAIHKCKNCLWANKVNKEVVFCMFPSCIRKGKKTDAKTKRNI